MTRTNLEWAIFYASLGWSVIPVTPKEKTPLIKWLEYQNRRADEEEIRRWFSSSEEIGVGIVTGKISGIVVLDGDGEEGVNTLEEMERSEGLQIGIRAFTPRGGEHRIFLHPGEQYVVPNRARMRPGLDVRGDGGYIVVAPSMHPVGSRYHWDVDAHPEDVLAGRLPNSVLVEIIAHEGQRAPSSFTVQQRAGMFGLPDEQVVTDGREQYMRDTILAVASDLRKRLGRLPVEQELFQAAWPQYAAHVDLSRPGRGQDEFMAKVRYTLRRAAGGQIRGFDRPHSQGSGLLGVGDAETEQPASYPASPFSVASVLKIPPRRWIYNRFMLRQYVSLLGAPGGTGKTAYIIGVAICIALGKNYMDEPVHEQCNVWLLNLEDPMDEILRRIWAFCVLHKIDMQELEGKLFVDSGRDRPMIMAERTGDGVVALPIVDAVKAEIEEKDIGVIIVDPFIRTHSVDENKSGEINFVASIWGKLCNDTNCSAALVQHFRKGSVGGDADAFRGSSALIDAARSAYTLAVMQDKDADTFGIDMNDRRQFVRHENAKSNLAPAPNKSFWFRLHNINLPNGDEVQAVSHWSPPTAFDQITSSQISEIIRRIRTDKAPDGYPYRAGRQAKHWVGDIIIEATGKTEQQAAIILKTWVENGILVKKETVNERHKMSFYEVDTNNANRMLRDISGSIIDDSPDDSPDDE